MKTKISIMQAFRAMVCFLESYYKKTSSDDIGSLLGDLQLFDDGSTWDPAAWSDWIMVLDNKKALTTIEAYQAMTRFLEKYYNSTKSDDVGSLLGGMDMGFWENGKPFDPALWSDWIEAVEEVLKTDSRS